MSDEKPTNLELFQKYTTKIMSLLGDNFPEYVDINAWEIADLELPNLATPIGSFAPPSPPEKDELLVHISRDTLTWLLQAGYIWKFPNEERYTLSLKGLRAQLIVPFPWMID